MKKLLIALLATTLCAFAAAPKKDRVEIPVTKRDVSEATKREVLNKAGVAPKDHHLYVVDHIVPLELGGSNNVTNLQAQKIADGKAKDKIEQEVTAKVREGTMTRTEALKILMAWKPAR